LTQILNFGATTDFIIGLSILIMAVSHMPVHWYSFRGDRKLVAFLTYVSSLWAAFLIIYFPTAIIFELYDYVIKSRLFDADLASLVLSPAQTFVIPSIISIAVNFYGYFEATNLQVERLTIYTSKLPEKVNKITVAQISDLHLGIMVGDKKLDRVIREIETAKPDLIVSTGDLVDGVVRHIIHYTDKLKKLQAWMGKFAVLGNHEFYGGLKHSLKFTEDSGFTVLRGEVVNIKEILNVAGVDERADTNNNHSNMNNTIDVLSGIPQNIFTLLLKHRADMDSRSSGLFDLQLSGHTHKGQMFPVSLFTMFIFKHHSGYKKLQKGSDLYISRGAGTAGTPIRFLSKPEITIIDIVSEKSSTMV
jgi:predicted MPP superfamily phosphohydrolase